jgi:SAM-dependent methyltransferase
MILGFSTLAIYLLYQSNKSITWLLIVTVIVLIVATAAVSSIMLPGFVGAPYVPTSSDLVTRILSLAEIKPGDVLYDLGSGDGRLVISAARDFGAISVGIEIDPFRVLFSRIRIWRQNLARRVRIIRNNFFKIDLKDADIVVMFLLQETNDRLQRKLEQDLKKPDARVVSIVFQFRGWKLIRADEMNMIYVYEPHSVL